MGNLELTIRVLIQFIKINGLALISIILLSICLLATITLLCEDTRWAIKLLRGKIND